MLEYARILENISLKRMLEYTRKPENIPLKQWQYFGTLIIAMKLNELINIYIVTKKIQKYR